MARALWLAHARRLKKHSDQPRSFKKVVGLMGFVGLVPVLAWRLLPPLPVWVSRLARDNGGR